MVEERTEGVLPREDRSSTILVETRELFDQSLEELVAEDRDDSFAVLIVGLDRFKVLNETMGHAIGDAVLQLCRGRLLSALRESDRLFRLPGDEFAILLRSQL